MNIPFSKVDCSGNELKYITSVIESGWLTTAGKCAEFEARFAEAVGAKYACTVNSATAALHLAAEALGIGPGDKVLVPTMTFTASAEVIRYLGADPVFLDVEYGTCLVTPEILETAIRVHSGVKALVLVHFGGQTAEMGWGGGQQTADCRLKTEDCGPGILEICRRHGIRVIEDAAHAFPTRYNGRMIGSFGDVTCFSFYANKTITTGEGGMLVTNDEQIYRRVKTMRLHGINRDIWDRFTAKKVNWEYDVVAPGFKYNMPDVNAAIGLAQMERAEEFRRGRQRCAEFYYEHLSGVAGIDLPIYRGPREDHSWHLFWVVLNEEAGLDRNALIECLNAAGIGTSVHYKPLHRMTYYRDRYGLKSEDYPNAERHWKGCVTLPVYPGLSNADLAYVCRTVKDVLAHAHASVRGSEQQLQPVVYATGMDAARARRVLVIDDDAAWGASVARILAGVSGVEVATATDGAAGLDMARRQLPDLILLDIRMPGRDGFEVLWDLKQTPETRGVSVVMVSAVNDAESRQIALSAKAEAYLTKPVRPGCLRDLVSSRWCGESARRGTRSKATCTHLVS